MNAYVNKALLFSTVLVFFLVPFVVKGQSKIIKGVIKDAHSDERIPFASISFKNSGSGKLSDSAGNFIFRFDNWPSDTIEVTYVGYKDYVLPLDSLSPKLKGEVLDITILLERGKYAAEVVVKRKIDRAFPRYYRQFVFTTE